MKRANFPDRKTTRRTQAALRQEEHDALTVDQKIQKAIKRGASPDGRELTRLRQAQ